MSLHRSKRQTSRAALLTPRGRGAVATVRLIGLCGIVDQQTPRLFQSAGGRHVCQYEVGRAVYGRWGRDVPEDVVVCRIDDTTTDIHCHGGDAASARILDDLRSAGCVVQTWREMSTDESGLLETELAEALSRAVTVRTADILLEQKSSLLQSGFEQLRQLSRDLETPETGHSKDALIDRIDDLLRWSAFGIHLTQPWKTVIAGRTNAGKSSLINAFLGYSRSIVFDEPGTTRDVVTAQTAFAGWPVELADTAGIRGSADELESAGIERARRQFAEADCRILLLDVSRPRSVEEERLLAEWPDAIRVGHKHDLPNLWGVPLPADILRVSSLTGTGLEELAAEMIARLVPEVPPPGTPIPVTHRQINLLEQARVAIASGEMPVGFAALDEILS